MSVSANDAVIGFAVCFWLLFCCRCCCFYCNDDDNNKGSTFIVIYRSMFIWKIMTHLNKAIIQTIYLCLGGVTFSSLAPSSSSLCSYKRPPSRRFCMTSSSSCWSLSSSLSPSSVHNSFFKGSSPACG